MSTTEKLCAMINERAEAGLKKYGVTVDRKDLTADQWLQHAIEEMLDGAAYLMRLREEIRNMERELSERRKCEAMFNETEGESK